MIREKSRLHTTLNTANLTALKMHGLTNGFKTSELIDEAVEQFLQNEMIRVTIWLPIGYIEFLRSNHINLEKIIQEPLATEVRVAYENKKITAEEADELIKLLGFRKGLREI